MPRRCFHPPLWTLASSRALSTWYELSKQIHSHLFWPPPIIFLKLLIATVYDETPSWHIVWKFTDRILQKVPRYLQYFSIDLAIYQSSILSLQVLIFTSLYGADLSYFLSILLHRLACPIESFSTLWQSGSTELKSGCFPPDTRLPCRAPTPKCNFCFVFVLFCPFVFFSLLFSFLLSSHPSLNVFFFPGFVNYKSMGGNFAVFWRVWYLLTSTSFWVWSF